MVKAKMMKHCFNYFSLPIFFLDSSVTVHTLNMKFVVMLSVLSQDYKTYMYIILK